MKQIHWYPGHMKKAQIEVQEKVKICDMVIELLDSRIPFSSRNETLFRITKDKTRLIVLTKPDLADKTIVNQWINKYLSEGYHAISADLNKTSDIKRIVNEATSMCEKKNEKLIAKGMKPQPIRAMVIGIPNVGKSTLINKIANRRAASVQNKPGHTRSQQWIKVSEKFELLDTPGILPPSFNNDKSAINLALTGSINENILPNEDLARIAYDFLSENYPDSLLKRFSYLDLNDNFEASFENIAKRRGYLLKGGLDMEKAYKVFLNELKNGLIGQISFERI